MSADIPVIQCFERLIAIDGQCGEPAARSGVYLKDIGISRSELSAYLTDQYINEQELFESKLRAAIIDIESQFHSFFNPRYKAFSVVENSRIGIFQKNQELVSGEAGHYKGVHLSLNNRQSFLDFESTQISLQLNHTGTVEVVFIDLIQGQIISSVEIDVTPYTVATTNIRELFTSHRQIMSGFIGYDSTGIQSVKTLLKSPSGCRSCDTSTVTVDDLTIRPAIIGTGDQLIDSSLTYGTDTGGLSILYNLSCNHRQWICNVAPRLAISIAWKTAAQLMAHALYDANNEQANVRTMDVETLEKRRVHYDRQGDKALASVLQNIVLPQDDRCFVCKQHNRVLSFSV